ncbi:YbhB/YbcL family Raf kinase inhibitor-like protein [Peristeroidobacter agariperforans]|uniref:YbhB/YbcL family Raf kinase inhibitor-like protein n=1 Tax=Peristeroidobacter agariperforans TaxID=268404 RepID=UPI00101BBA4A|nr:YbhB/YbcL family Raf kinase inhibitor-like protein [Peristeroidobacter agariperforans]
MGNKAGVVCLGMFASVLSPSLGAQQGQLTDVSIQGFVYEPRRLPATDARIQSLTVPQGFHLQRFAEGLDNPRMLAVADDGAVYVTQRTPGNLVMLRDTDNDGIADIQKIVLRQRDLHGIAIRGREIFLTDIKTIYAADILADGRIGERRIVSARLPDGGQHPNRTLAFSPQGDLFVSVGSTCNECREPNPQHATLQRVTDDAARRSRPDQPAPREIYASGLRNSLGFGWHPDSGRLYAFDNGIDWLGNDEQSEELNELTEAGQRFGWPYVYDDDQINPHTEPLETSSEQWAGMSEEPVGMYAAHAAPMQMTFYTGSQFPTEYRNDAFVAMRGSWNRKPPHGYEVVRVRFDASGGFTAFEPFVTGFIQPVAGGHGFFGRPVGVTSAKDGALLFTDDTNNMIYRVAAAGAAASADPQVIAKDIFDAPATIAVSSSAIPAGGVIDVKYTDYGRGISPPLRWSSLPSGTQSLVLMMEDPDAVAPLPFVHWTMINLPPSLSALPANVSKAFAPLRGQPARQGSNSKSERGYFGPRPPAGDPPHRYHFQIFALDTKLDLPDGFNRHALLDAMRGHVLANGELIGTFQAPQ